MKKQLNAEKDIYQQVTDRIISALEKGTAPWKRLWRSTDKQSGDILPINAMTGNHYNDVNILLLWMSAEEMGTNINRWLTYRQAHQLGEQNRLFNVIQCDGLPEHLDSYIEHWLSVLKKDKKALFRACKQAREASEYLLNFRTFHNAKVA
ncbi:DUF1738 domain-containing protein [Xenorhabdus sp. Flor]|uniref:ArdC-like ssDNA-binding domain-containing protein n=1 Tax=Xenorhabdus cabanillasii TaxID=351673 RepID=UPI0019B2A0F4|nr:ArdC-like ssDNA-binding domain-containing protein [Xenorhabdus sp. Flor]MBD2813971.1 DUF1738 domain-containing protein [Xenorhabdus sp. Flor]